MYQIWSQYIHPLQRHEGDRKCTKQHGLVCIYGSLKLTGNSTIQQSAYLNMHSVEWCSLVFYSHYIPIFWDIARYWLKVADFKLLHLYLEPLLGVIPFEFHQDLWHQKTRIPGLSYDIWPFWENTDLWQMDRQTCYCTNIASCRYKWNFF